MDIIDSIGRNQRVNVVNWYGAFDTVLMSRTEQAKRGLNEDDVGTTDTIDAMGRKEYRHFK